MECPLCGCQDFYVKDPDDEFETHGFNVASGEVRFSSDSQEAPPPNVQETIEAFCNRCSWHGKLRELKKT